MATTKSSAGKSAPAKPKTTAGKPKPAAKPAQPVKARAPAKAKPATKTATATAAAKPARTRARKSAVVPPEQRRHYIEMAAYYIAERRGFAPGNPLEDWVQAEAEIDRLLAEGRLGC